MAVQECVIAASGSTGPPSLECPLDTQFDPTTGLCLPNPSASGMSGSTGPADAQCQDGFYFDWHSLQCQPLSSVSGSTGATGESHGGASGTSGASGSSNTGCGVGQEPSADGITCVPTNACAAGRASSVNASCILQQGTLLQWPMRIITVVEGQVTYISAQWLTQLPINSSFTLSAAVSVPHSLAMTNWIRRFVTVSTVPGSAQVAIQFLNDSAWTGRVNVTVLITINLVNAPQYRLGASGISALHVGLIDIDTYGVAIQAPSELIEGQQQPAQVEFSIPRTVEPIECTSQAEKWNRRSASFVCGWAECTSSIQRHDSCQ